MEATEPVLERVVAFILQNQLIPRFATVLTPRITSIMKPSMQSPWSRERTSCVIILRREYHFQYLRLTVKPNQTLFFSMESVSPTKRHELLRSVLKMRLSPASRQVCNMDVVHAGHQTSCHYICNSYIPANNPSAGRGLTL